MKSGILATLLCLLLSVTVLAQRSAVLKSPSGNIYVKLLTENGQLQINVSNKQSRQLFILTPGMEINKTNIAADAKWIGMPRRTTIKEQYPIFGNHTVATNFCNEIAVPFQKNTLRYVLVLRAYNDGVALRYQIQTDKSVYISKDLTSFSIAANANCIWSDYEPSYENLSHLNEFAAIDDNKELTAPFAVLQDRVYLSFSESANFDFPDMVWEKTPQSIEAKFPTNPNGWEVAPQNGIISSPWRMAIIAPNLTQLVNSDLIMNLNSAPKPEMDFQWVRPGRVLWQWWSIGEPQLQDQKSWYDAAAEMKWEYYLIDDGWRVWKQQKKDQWQCLKEVINYGKTKGVKTIIWVDSREMRNRESMRAYLEKVKQAGASGIKIDFFPPATPEIMKLYEMAREETYRLQLLVNFHGCAKPTGINRTWPHELTREAVRGNEYQMTRYNRLLPQNEYTMTAFTRFLAGPADVTPVIFSLNELKHFTWAHELAQAIVLLSPLTHFADSYTEYVNHPAKDLLQQMPTTWDETIVLPFSEPGKIAGFAKRKGNVWWIGILNGGQEKNLSFNFKFLKKAANALIVEDVPQKLNAIKRHRQTVLPTSNMKLQLQPGGGGVLRLTLK